MNFEIAVCPTVPERIVDSIDVLTPALRLDNNQPSIKPHLKSALHSSGEEKQYKKWIYCYCEWINEYSIRIKLTRKNQERLRAIQNL